MKLVEDSRERERKMSVRIDDIGTLRKGIEIFVEGMSVPRAIDYDDVQGVEGGEGGEGGDVGSVIGWGGKQVDVKERIIGNRVLLAGIYSLTEGLEGLLEGQQARQQENDRTGKYIEKNQAELFVDKNLDDWKAENDDDLGLIKESKSESFDMFEGPEKVEKKVEKKRMEEKEKMVDEEKVTVPKVTVGWSPGAAVAVKDIPPVPVIPPVHAVDIPIGSVGENVMEGDVSDDVKVNGSYDLSPEDFILFITDDLDVNEDSFFYNDVVGSNNSVESNFFDTTVENTEKDSDKVIQFLTTSLDVMFFLFETIIKAVGPILLGGGALAADRANEALFSDSNISFKEFKRVRKGSKKGTKKEEKKEVQSSQSEEGTAAEKIENIRSWKMLSDFRKQSSA